jgi:PAS domain S-box-containing protein
LKINIIETHYKKPIAEMQLTFDIYFSDKIRAAFKARQLNENMPIIIVHRNGHSFPIVFATPAFIDLSGYPLHEILGRNPGFLHGPGTDKEVVGCINRAVTDSLDICAVVMNYRKDGSTFLNKHHLFNIKNNRDVVEFIVVVNEELAPPRMISVTDREEVESRTADDEEDEAVDEEEDGVVDEEADYGFCDFDSPAVFKPITIPFPAMNA